jgi:hypothetical protein
MCFNRQSGFVGRLILLRGNEARGIFDERVPADVTAEGVAGSMPRGPSCHIVGMEKQTAYRVGLTVRAFRTTTTHPDKTDRIGNSLESSRRQQNEGGVCGIPRRLAKIFCDQELTRRTTRRDVRGQIDCAADIVTLTVEHTAVVCSSAMPVAVAGSSPAPRVRRRLPAIICSLFGPFVVAACGGQTATTGGCRIQNAGQCRQHVRSGAVE